MKVLLDDLVSNRQICLLLAISTFYPWIFPFSAERVVAIIAAGWHVTLAFAVLADPHFWINVFTAFEKGSEKCFFCFGDNSA